MTTPETPRKPSASAAPPASGATAGGARRSWCARAASTTWCSTTWPRLTMSILAPARAKKPELGYATDFVDSGDEPVLAEQARAGHPAWSAMPAASTRTAAPRRCRRWPTSSRAWRCASRWSKATTCSALLPRAARGRHARHVHAASRCPRRLLSANAYLGALPIARALAAGADIVITGRCVDSAVTLGRADARVRLGGRRLRPAGRGQPRRPHHRMRLPGHRRPAHRLGSGARLGRTSAIPIIECHADGSFVVTKPAGHRRPGHAAPTSPSSCSTRSAIPAAYLLPDVSCDFRAGAHGAGRRPTACASTGARGRAPTASYKVSATQHDGFRCAGS